MYIWNLFNSSHELHKTIVRNCFYNKGSTLAENIRYFMYKYDSVAAYLHVYIYLYTALSLYICYL